MSNSTVIPKPTTTVAELIEYLQSLPKGTEIEVFECTSEQYEAFVLEDHTTYGELKGVPFITIG